MEDTDRNAAIKMFECASNLLESIPPRERKNIDEAEIVFTDLVNNKLKWRRAYTVLEMFSALKDGSKPIGLIFLSWCSLDGVDAKGFPGLTDEEQSLLMHALAEAQDERKEEMGNGEEDE